MKIAIASDVHGNYPALSAVIADAKSRGVEQFIFAGDYVTDFAYPNEVVDCLRRLNNALVIRGNRENYLIGLAKKDSIDLTCEQMAGVYRTFYDLTGENFSYLDGLKENGFLQLPYSGQAYVTHFVKELDAVNEKTNCTSSRFKKEMMRRTFTHNDFLEQMAEFLRGEDITRVVTGIDADVIINGHTHLQWYGYCGGKLIINPGSCGEPLDYNTNAPYTLLEDTPSGLTVEEIRVCYDTEEAIRYTKGSEFYQKGRVWCELIFAALREGCDVFSDFFTIAGDLANKKNETGEFFSNETWNQAARIYFGE